MQTLRIITLPAQEFPKVQKEGAMNDPQNPPEIQN